MALLTTTTLRSLAVTIFMTRQPLAAVVKEFSSASKILIVASTVSTRNPLEHVESSHGRLPPLLATIVPNSLRLRLEKNELLRLRNPSTLCYLIPECLVTTELPNTDVSTRIDTTGKPPTLAVTGSSIMLLSDVVKENPIL